MNGEPTMLAVGIDSMAFYTPRYYLDLCDFAQARGQDVDKYHRGLGQFQMSIAPPNEDIVTMAANASTVLLNEAGHQDIDAIFFATESGFDSSKAAAVYLHHLLGLPRGIRCIELKQACYAGAFGLQMACDYVRARPSKKVLLVASDIAIYGFNSAAESSQGAAAVAMLITAEPRLLEMDEHASFCSQEASDFWRPVTKPQPFVDGKRSVEVYLALLGAIWQDYCQQSGRDFYSHVAYCYHSPVPKLVEKAHRLLVKSSGVDLSAEAIRAQTEAGLQFARCIGNSYTASLFISLLSHLIHAERDHAGQLLGLYSYGSGSVAEFFALRCNSNAREHLRAQEHQAHLRSRTPLDMGLYEQFYRLPRHQLDEPRIPQYDCGAYRLIAIEQGSRRYQVNR